MNKWLSLIIGGSLGTLTRYALSTWAVAYLPPDYPYGTVAANMLGCLILGVILGGVEGRMEAQTLATNPFAHVVAQIPHTFRMLVMVGFLGALTTFSSLEMESFLMVKAHELPKAIFYLAGSIVLGFVVLWFSYSWARWFFGVIKWN